MPKSGRSGCPISVALDVLGDRWSLLILRDVIFAGKRTFNQFLGSDEAIATNILRDRLETLVAAGLLIRSPDTRHKQKIIYSLTDSAIALVPVLMHLGYWGQQRLPASTTRAKTARRLFHGGPREWNRLMERLSEEHLQFAVR